MLLLFFCYCPHSRDASVNCERKAVFGFVSAFVCLSMALAFVLFCFVLFCCFCFIVTALTLGMPLSFVNVMPSLGYFVSLCFGFCFVFVFVLGCFALFLFLGEGLGFFCLFGFFICLFVCFVGVFVLFCLFVCLGGGGGW